MSLPMAIASFDLTYRFTKDLDPLKELVRNCADLDYLWAEFFLTGNTEAIKKIIEVLKWPDRIRSRVNTWLSLRGPPQSDNRRRCLDGGGAA